MADNELKDYLENLCAAIGIFIAILIVYFITPNTWDFIEGIEYIQ